MLWLHKQGYTCFDIPKLTYQEINGLIDAKKRELKKQEQEQKRAEQKAKSRGRYKR
jgi:hypothetical protein